MGEAKYIYFTCLNRSRRETKLNSKGLKNSSIAVMSHSGPVIPAFVDLSEAQQASELLVFLKGLGAEVSEEYKPEDGLPGNVHSIVEASTHAWTAPAESDAEAALNSLINLILMMPPDRIENMVITFCEKIQKASPTDKNLHPRLRLLSNLFYSLPEMSTMRYHVYLAMIRVAGEAQKAELIPHDLDEVKDWAVNWNLSPEQKQTLLRALYDASAASTQNEVSTKLMLELLGTYSDEDASQARDDAHRCIVTCVGDKGTFLLDHLLLLKPVKFLEGELIHDLLVIFVSGTLQNYLEFYNTNPDFIASLGLSHEANIHKMRILTFMSMSTGDSKVIPFSEIQLQLHLSADDVESFIIEVVKSKMVRCKMDQMNQCVTVSAAKNRTFGKPQWQQLHERLNVWRDNLQQVYARLNTISQLQQTI